MPLLSMEDIDPTGLASGDEMSMFTPGNTAHVSATQLARIRLPYPDSLATYGAE